MGALKVCIVRDSHFCSNTGLLVEMLLEHKDIVLDIYLFNMQEHIYFQRFVEKYGDDRRCNIFVIKRRFNNSYINTLYSFGAVWAKGLSAKKKYDCVIGIEQAGLIHAYLYFKRSTKKLVYYSLELMHEYQQATGNRFTRFMLWLERRAHGRSGATIIQDPARADKLFAFNRIVKKQPVILIPVCVKGDKVTEKGKYYQEKFSLPGHSKLTLFFANTLDPDFAGKLKEVSEKLDDGQVIILQGNKSRFPNVYESSVFENGDRYYANICFLDDDELERALSSVRIGLVLYPQSDANHQLTLFSSGKIAYYSRFGIPFIAFSNPYYLQQKRPMGCYELIDDIDDLPEAIRLIDKDYDRYSENAFQSYDQYYKAENRYGALYDYIIQ